MGKFIQSKLPQRNVLIFTQILEDAIKQCVPKKSFHKERQTQPYNPRKLHQPRNKVDRSMHPTDQTYLSLKRVFLENPEANRLEDQIATFNNLTTENVKWKFKNESRNARRTETEITSLKHCFGDHVTDQKKIANLLNFRFSKIGNYMGTGDLTIRQQYTKQKSQKSIFVSTHQSS